VPEIAAAVILKRKMELSKMGAATDLQCFERKWVITQKVHLGAMGARLKSSR